MLATDRPLDTLSAGFAEYLVTYIHDFVQSRLAEPGDLLPEYKELLARLGVLSASAVTAFVVNPLVNSGSVDDDALRQQIGVLYDDIPDEMLSGMAEEAARVRRARYLLEAIPQRQETYGQLYHEEVGPMQELVARGIDASDEVVLEMLPQLEELWVLVFPGIRLHRGDADYIAALGRHLEDAVDRLHGEDLTNHMVQKCLFRLAGPPEIREKARAVLSQEITALMDEREQLEARSAEIDVRLSGLQDKKRALQ